MQVSWWVFGRVFLFWEGRSLGFPGWFPVVTQGEPSLFHILGRKKGVRTVVTISNGKPGKPQGGGPAEFWMWHSLTLERITPLQAPDSIGVPARSISG